MSDSRDGDSRGGCDQGGCDQGGSDQGVTWAIGDIHGRKRTLDAVLKRLDFDDSQDRLWLVGDLVNRGPDSLGVLRWARSRAARLGSRFACVLGNHDLHLLAMSIGLRKTNPDLAPVLEAADAQELIAWLRARPMLVTQGGRALVHAGFWPQWSLSEALSWARRVEESLRRRDTLLAQGKGRSVFKGTVFSGEVSSGEVGELEHGELEHGELKHRELEHRDVEVSALRAAVYAFTALRLVDSRGRSSSFKGPPEEAPDGHIPWFAVDGRRTLDVEIVCGHWAAMGLRLTPGIIALDSGVAWGGPLSACRLDDRTVVQQENLDTDDRL